MSSERPLTAIVYGEGAIVAGISHTIVERWRRKGLRICGLMERQIARPGRRRCDVIVTELASGEEIGISQDRGEFARGCRLIPDAFAHAISLVSKALDNDAQRLIINKFGKTEVEGGGLRDAIARAIEKEIPTVVFVPRRNIEAWREFARELSFEIDAQDFLLPRGEFDLELWSAGQQI